MRTAAVNDTTLVIEMGSGSIINLTSRNVARKGRAGAAAYGAAKAAVERLTESMAEELMGKGIAVNYSDPGWVLTRPNDDYDDEVHKRLRLPEDIGEVAVYLALQIPETLTGEWYRRQTMIRSTASNGPRSTRDCTLDDFKTLDLKVRPYLGAHPATG